MGRIPKMQNEQVHDVVAAVLTVAESIDRLSSVISKGNPDTSNIVPGTPNIVRCFQDIRQKLTDIDASPEGTKG